MELLPVELVSKIVKQLNYDSKINFALAMPLYIGEVKHLLTPKTFTKEDGAVFKRWYHNGYVEREEEDTSKVADHLSWIESIIEIRRMNKRGELHNENGPAVVRINPLNKKKLYVMWYHHGKRHKIDGPALTVWYTNGNVQREEWSVHGDLSTKKMYNENGTYYDQMWYKEQKLIKHDTNPMPLHHMNPPINNKYKSSCEKCGCDEWSYIYEHNGGCECIVDSTNVNVGDKKNNINENECKPTRVEYENGILVGKRWLVNELSGACYWIYVDYYKSGNLKSWLKSRMGRESETNEPSEVEWFENGRKKCERWKFNGCLSRFNGPAEYEYFENGKIKKECWSVDGEFHRVNGAAITNLNKHGGIVSQHHYLEGKYYRTENAKILAFNKHHNNKNKNRH